MYEEDSHDSALGQQQGASPMINYLVNLVHSIQPRNIVSFICCYTLLTMIVQELVNKKTKSALLTAVIMEHNKYTWNSM